jgi:hypothetical protein
MRRTLRWGIAVAVVLEIGLVSAYAILNDKLQVYYIGTQFPEIAGIDLDGEMRKVTKADCYVIRITSDFCAHCRADQPAYEEITNASRAAACQIVEVAPLAGDMASRPRDAVTQLKYVDMPLAKALYPYVTPQTIVLDADRKVKWKRVGKLTKETLASAIAVLETTTSP